MLAPAIGRDTTTVRSPVALSTALETTATDGASTVPAACLASLRSVTAPAPSTTRVQGASAMARAPNPAPNQTPAGPSSVISACSVVALSVTETRTRDAAVPATASMSAAHAVVEAASVLKRTCTVSGAAGSTAAEQPGGWLASDVVVLTKVCLFAVCLFKGPPTTSPAATRAAAAWKHSWNERMEAAHPPSL